MGIIYFRGLSKNYCDKKGKDADFSENFKPSYFRTRPFDLVAENDHYLDMLGYIREFNIQLKSDIAFNEASPKYALKIMGYIQHYGFESRLLDVSRDKEVAEYFACCENFNEDGYVVTFNDENIVSRSPDAAVTVHYKLRHFLKKEITSQRIQFKNKHIITDYTKLFGTKSTNCRYEKQSGGFILFCSDRDSINYHLVENADYFKERIPKGKKISKLLEASKNGKNYVELFPDSEKSMRLYALYKGFSSGVISLQDVTKKLLSEKDRKKLDEDPLRDLLKRKYVFYLFFNELLPILFEGDKESVSELVKGIERVTRNFERRATV